MAGDGKLWCPACGRRVTVKGARFVHHVTGGMACRASARDTLYVFGRELRKREVQVMERVNGREAN